MAAPESAQSEVRIFILTARRAHPPLPSPPFRPRPRSFVPLRLLRPPPSPSLASVLEYATALCYGDAFLLSWAVTTTTLFRAASRNDPQAADKACRISPRSFLKNSRFLGPQSSTIWLKAVSPVKCTIVMEKLSTVKNVSKNCTWLEIQCRPKIALPVDSQKLGSILRSGHSSSSVRGVRYKRKVLQLRIAGPCQYT